MRVSIALRRCLWFLLLTNPLIAVRAAPFLPRPHQQADSFSVADALCVAVALLLLIASYIVEFVLLRSRVPLPRRIDLPWMFLLTGVGGSSAVSLIGLAAIQSGGAFGTHVHGWVAVSTAGMLFYSWRHRRALKSGG